MKDQAEQRPELEKQPKKRQSGVTNSRAFRPSFGPARMYRSTALGVFVNASKHLADTRHRWHQKCEPTPDLRPRNSPKSDCLFNQPQEDP
jgi:hypothetical protein